jgi:hypothetical protein
VDFLHTICRTRRRLQTWRTASRGARHSFGNPDFPPPYASNGTRRRRKVRCTVERPQQSASDLDDALVHYVVRVAFKARGGPWLEHYPRGIVQTDDVHVPFMVYRCLLLSSVQVSKKIKAKILSKVRATFFFLTWNGVKKKISRTLLRVAPPLFPGQPGHRPTPTSFADAFENLLQFLLGKPILFYRRHFWHLQAMARRCEYVAATKLVDVGFSIFSHIVGPFLERSRHSPLALLFYFTDRPKKLTDAPPA